MTLSGFIINLTQDTGKQASGFNFYARAQVVYCEFEKIETIERSRIVFGKIYIPVSDQYKEKFQEFVNKNFL